VLTTDLTDFTAWAEQAELAAVESQLEFWESVHQLAASHNGGVVRMVMGDSFLLTFDDIARAITAWKEINAHVDAYNDGPGTPRRLRFRAGLAAGDVRVFRSAMYGHAVNEAHAAVLWTRGMSPRCIGFPAALAASVQGAGSALEGLELRCSGDRATLREAAP
jgi:class 3 adenylate cyclase